VAQKELLATVKTKHFVNISVDKNSVYWPPCLDMAAEFQERGWTGSLLHWMSPRVQICIQISLGLEAHQCGCTL
jgi:hypothetical protein